MNTQTKRVAMVMVVALFMIVAAPVLRAAERMGQVTFAGLALPGATVIVTQGDKRLATTTDQQGVYRFADLAEGAWTIRVEMTGFVALSRELTIGADAALPVLELSLRPFAEIARESPAPQVTTTAPTSPTAAPGAPRTAANTPSAANAPAVRPALPVANATPGAPPPPADGAAAAATPTPASAATTESSPFGAADGLLINGSVNNSATSPFAQAAGFGNARPGGRSLYNGGIGAILGNSAWDARPYSFTDRQAPKPDYTDVQFLSTFGGPVKIPGVRNRATVFLGYQHIQDTNATTQSALLPTFRERVGDFSQSVDAFGQPVQVIDPQTGLPFANNIIPAERLAPQARALMGYYPVPNADGDGRYNYQTPIIIGTQTDSVQSRISQSINARNSINGSLAYQRTATDSINVFGFADSTIASGFDGNVTWSHRRSQFLTLRFRYQLTTLGTRVTPYFANQTNVSGDAGIAGNNQDPANWGPPSLIFSSGIAGLSDVQFAHNRNWTNAWNGEAFWSHGRHNVTFGGDFRLQHNNVLSQQDPRGTFGFTGALTGSDIADFLLGVPNTSSIAFGNADKFLRARSYDAYVNDDWRVSPAFTVTAGVRWEYETPINETQNRLANLDVTPGFTDIASVVATDPEGTLTGEQYPRSLIRPDRLGLQPRLGLAWRPVPGSSLVVRAGYGVYRNAGIYQSIASLLAQQPPFSNTSSVENNAALALTLANGFVQPGPTSNTFAVDPNLRVGLAQNWQVSAQRDLPASLTVLATYFGTHGSRLLQEFLPNTYPVGAVNPCATCPVGYVYLTSSGASNRHAAQIQLRRRLRNGFTATVQYTLANARDNAGAFSGVNLSGPSIAQDWTDLDAEWAPSNFDQRHLLTAQVQYTTGVGTAGGALLDGLSGALYKGWTFTTQLTTGSGLPVTPIYLTPVDGTGVSGTIRADALNTSGGAPEGYYLDPASYAAPQSGEWGNAGRNSGRGPAQFSLNAGVTRSFQLNERLTLDWRLDATNVLNQVTFSSINSIFGSPQFGLPNRANSMRKIQSTIRVRF